MATSIFRQNAHCDYPSEKFIIPWIRCCKKPGQRFKTNILILEPVSTQSKWVCTDQQSLQQRKQWLTHTYVSVTFVPTLSCSSCVTGKQGTAAAEPTFNTAKVRKWDVGVKTDRIRLRSLSRTFSKQCGSYPNQYVTFTGQLLGDIYTIAPAGKIGFLCC